MLIIIGPCSIHDPEAAMDYADKLQQVSNQYEAELEIVMLTKIYAIAILLTKVARASNNIKTLNIIPLTPYDTQRHNHYICHKHYATLS